MTFPQGGDPCGGLGGNICFINGDANSSEQPRNIADWTAGYEPRTTSITLSNTTGLQVGSLLVLDQLGSRAATVGERVNYGAGSITANYDGANKHRTTIGADAHIGSNVVLVAPIAIGAGATSGGGSTIAKDAPADQLTVARARQASLPGWKRPTKKR